MIDLKPYQQVINTISSELETITDTTWQVVSRYTEQEKQVFTKSLRQLGHELRTMREIFTCMIESYVLYKALQGRQKRPLLPFVGKAMHFLFGAVTDSDFKAVRRNVEHLAENQQKLKHVVEDSHILINLNRLKITENRQTTNELIYSLAEVDNRLETLLQRVEKDIY